MTGPAGSPAWEASGGAAYESLISDQLAEERKRKESLEQRAAFALTSGGGFVTLTLGIAALVTRAQDFALPENARTLLLAAVVAFGLSAAAAIAANVPFRYSAWAHRRRGMGRARVRPDGDGSAPSDRP